jgi:CheY-like chemotaxis protein
MSDYILIVDDDPDLRALLEDVLGLLGYMSRQAQNGFEALQMLQADTPSAIILDLKMPVMDGAAMLKHLEKQPFQDIRVLLLTAFVDPDFRCGETGRLNGVLSKGAFTFAALKGALSAVGLSPSL